jgi:hypothetical protein
VAADERRGPVGVPVVDGTTSGGTGDDGSAGSAGGRFPAD